MLEDGTDLSIRQDGCYGMAVSKVDDQRRVLHPRVEGGTEDGRRTGVHYKGLKSPFYQGIPHCHHPGHLLRALFKGEILQASARTDGCDHMLEPDLAVWLAGRVAVVLYRHGNILRQRYVE